MTEVLRCETCGGPLTQGGLLASSCPRCLFSLASEPEAPQDSSIGRLERSEAESLLHAHDHAGSFLDTLPLEMASEVPSQERANSMIGRRVGSFEILSLVGSGGMGEVYRARDTRLERTVAIKFLPSRLSSNHELRQRLEREALAISRLNHPNICTLFDIGQHEDANYLVMEHLEGETLEERLTRGPLPIDQALRYGTQIADALQAAHRQGITHRDIKPGNIMLVGDSCKLLDFGLAKLNKPLALAAASGSATEPGKNQTAKGTILGTVQYMAPEQLEGREVDGRTDIFAFGALLYEMVTGHKAFQGESKASLIAAIMSSDPAPVSTLQPMSPRALDHLVRRCLAKKPEERWQTTLDVKKELERILLPATSNSVPRRNRAFLTRRWQIPATLLVAAAIGTLYLLTQIYGTDSSQQIKSIAVFSLRNLSGDPAQEYVADGMTEALTHRLAQIGALTVVSHSVARSGEPPLEVARKLNVDAFVEGSVQAVNGRVKVMINLVHGRTGRVLLPLLYEESPSDILKLESAAARKIAEKIRIHVTPEEDARLSSAPTVNPVAYDEYRLGRFQLWKGVAADRARAVDHFKLATELDPGFADAHAGVALAWLMRASLGSEVRIEEAEPIRAAVGEALRLDSNLADAHVAQGLLHWFADKNWSEGEKAIKHALELDSNNLGAHFFYARILMQMGRSSEAITQIQSAAQLSPYSGWVETLFGAVLYRARRFDEAIRHLNRAIELESQDAFAYIRLSDISVAMGQYHEALGYLEKARTLGFAPRRDGARFARVYARMGQRSEARRILGDIRLRLSDTKIRNQNLAGAYIALGEIDEAFRVLSRTDESSIDISDPQWDPVLSDPRWQELLRRIDYPTSPPD